MRKHNGFQLRYLIFLYFHRFEIMQLADACFVMALKLVEKRFNGQARQNGTYQNPVAIYLVAF
ncbi:hypothetical protein D3C71_1154590 [compost metagenome]